MLHIFAYDILLLDFSFFFIYTSHHHIYDPNKYLIYKVGRKKNNASKICILVLAKVNHFCTRRNKNSLDFGNKKEKKSE